MGGQLGGQNTKCIINANTPDIHSGVYMASYHADLGLKLVSIGSEVIAHLWSQWHL